MGHFMKFDLVENIQQDCCFEGKVEVTKTSLKNECFSSVVFTLMMKVSIFRNCYTRKLTESNTATPSTELHCL